MKAANVKSVASFLAPIVAVLLWAKAVGASTESDEFATEFEVHESGEWCDVAWAPQDVSFNYSGSRTRYTCPEAKSRLRTLLQELGAKLNAPQDIRIMCSSGSGARASRFLNFRVWFQVPIVVDKKRASHSREKVEVGHWARVIVKDKDDCELYQQFFSTSENESDRGIITAFEYYNLRNSTVCFPGGSEMQNTRVSVEVPHLLK